MQTSKPCVVCGNEFFKKSTCSKKEWETKTRFCSKACWYKQNAVKMNGNRRGFKKGLVPWNKGVEWSPQHKERLSKIHLAKPNRYWEGKERRDLWAGKTIGYSALHKWLYKTLGQPSTCEHCGKTGLSGVKINWANKYHTYQKNAEDWMRLCVGCHRRYDKEVLHSKRK
jgi:hypothetical protein